MAPGTIVKYTSYGVTKSGAVSRLSRDGKIVFLTNGRWIHTASIIKE